MCLFFRLLQSFYIQHHFVWSCFYHFVSFRIVSVFVVFYRSVLWSLAKHINASSSWHSKLSIFSLVIFFKKALFLLFGCFSLWFWFTSWNHWCNLINSVIIHAFFLIYWFFLHHTRRPHSLISIMTFVLIQELSSCLFPLQGNYICLIYFLFIWSKSPETKQNNDLCRGAINQAFWKMKKEICELSLVKIISFTMSAIWIIPLLNKIRYNQRKWLE